MITMHVGETLQWSKGVNKNSSLGGVKGQVLSFSANQAQDSKPEIKLRWLTRQVIALRDSLNRWLMKRSGEQQVPLFDHPYVKLLYNRVARWIYVDPKVKQYVAVIPLLKKPIGDDPTPQDHVVILGTQRAAQQGRLCLEFPGGARGDKAGEENEPLEKAGDRELLEETGYQAKRLTNVAGDQFCKSPALTTMTGGFVLAEDLEKVSDQHGESEKERQIIKHVFVVPRKNIHHWLLDKVQKEGYRLSEAIPAGLFWLDTLRPMPKS